MKIDALVTGRGGNTMTDKNIRKVKAKPLVYYPTKAARGAVHVRSVYLSSDDDKILNATPELDIIKIKRPKELSGHNAKHIDVIIHAVDEISNRSNRPDILVVLLANSVTVKSSWIDDCINLIIKDNTIDSVVPVYQEQDHHPFRAKKIDSHGNLEPWFDFKDQNISTNRQELPDNFFLGHNFWVLNLNNGYLKGGGQKPWTFLGKKIKPFIVDECFDVHTEQDLLRCEEWLGNN